jgi:RNA-directed DNA polymerase
VQEIRGWDIHRRSDLELADLSRAHNAAIRGWINYYGRYCPSALRSVFYRLNWRLMQWARRKYKRFRTHENGAWDWLHRLARGSPDLFAHWRAGIVP